jgi:hypothetical protein
LRGTRLFSPVSSEERWSLTLLCACAVGKDLADYVLTRENGKPVRDLRGTWAKAGKAAGIPGLLFHDLRRTAARNLRRVGIAEAIIQSIGGWKTRSVFERYAIVTHTDIADAMRKLEAHEREYVTEKSHVFAVTVTLWTDKLPKAKSSIKLDFSSAYDLSRDGGTGRRSGLKIRRYLVPWGFNSPSRHQPLKVLI